MYSFDSNIQVGGDFGTFTQDEVKNEPMFFNSDIDYAYDNGGLITQHFLLMFVYEFLEKNPDLVDAKFAFDSRVHMLMPGWFPCIPGFHHDDVPRSKKNGQPNYDDPEYRSQHCFGLVNGDICPTEFAVGKIVLPEVRDDEIIYKVWHPLVDEAIKQNKMQSISAPSNKLVYFNDQSFHQGTRAVAGGWRWFGRISWNTDRVDKCTNEIRRQVQVYLEHPMEGW